MSKDKKDQAKPSDAKAFLAATKEDAKQAEAPKSDESAKAPEAPKADEAPKAPKAETKAEMKTGKSKAPKGPKIPGKFLKFQ